MVPDGNHSINNWRVDLECAMLIGMKQSDHERSVNVSSD